MTSKKAVFVFSGSLIAILTVFFVFLLNGTPKTTDSGTDDHDHDQAAANDHGFEGPVHGDPRLSKVLQETSDPEEAHEPLLKVLSQETFITGPYMAPRFTADGKHVLLSGDGYQGLWVTDLDGTNLRQITDGYMAGWRPVTTKDGDLIYRTAEIDEDGIITGFTIKIQNLKTGKEELVYTGANEDVYPPWLSQDEDMLFIRRDGEVIAHPLKESALSVPLHERDEGFPFADGGQVSYYHVGTDQVVPLSSDPQATGGEAASPDGKHIAYVSGNTDSALIVNLQTGNEVDIGEGANLNWSPNGQLLLYDVSSDDGHRILQSALFVSDANGENRQRLTFGDDVIANASWSHDGTKIIADTNQGKIFVFGVGQPTTSNK